LHEIVQAAEPLEIAAGVITDVARVGHLIAMKLVSRDPKRRPHDPQDLVALASVAEDEEWRRAEAAIELILHRGFSRGRDLRAASPRSARSQIADREPHSAGKLC
jgi:hypothetical protein